MLTLAEKLTRVENRFRVRWYMERHDTKDYWIFRKHKRIPHILKYISRSLFLNFGL